MIAYPLKGPHKCRKMHQEIILIKIRAESWQKRNFLKLFHSFVSLLVQTQNNSIAFNLGPTTFICISVGLKKIIAPWHLSSLHLWSGKDSVSLGFSGLNSTFLISLHIDHSLKRKLSCLINIYWCDSWFRIGGYNPSKGAQFPKMATTEGMTWTLFLTCPGADSELEE